MTYLTIPRDQLPFFSIDLQTTLEHFDCYRNPWNNTREYEIPAGVIPVLQSRHPETEGHLRRYPIDREQPSLAPRLVSINITTGRIQ